MRKIGGVTEEANLVRLYRGESLFESMIFKTLPQKGDIVTIRGEKFILSSHVMGFINEPGRLYAQIELSGTSSFVGNKSQMPKAAIKLMYFFIGAIAGYMIGIIVAGFIGGWYK